jgi:hypothetical protein
MKSVYWIVILLVGCNIRVPSTTPPPTPTEPILVTNEDVDACQQAEDRLRSLNCRRDDGTPRWLTPASAPFSEYCRVAISDGRSPRPDCIATIKSCIQLTQAYSTPEGTPCPSF